MKRKARKTLQAAIKSLDEPLWFISVKDKTSSIGSATALYAHSIKDAKAKALAKYPNGEIENISVL